MYCWKRCWSEHCGGPFFCSAQRHVVIVISSLLSAAPNHTVGAAGCGRRGRTVPWAVQYVIVLIIALVCDAAFWSTLRDCELQHLLYLFFFVFFLFFSFLREKMKLFFGFLWDSIALCCIASNGIPISVLWLHCVQQHAG